MLLLAGCASQATPAPTAMMEAGTPTLEAMMANSTATQAAMMATGMPDTRAMMTDTTTTPEDMAPTGMAMTETMMATGTPSGMMMENNWLAMAMTDVNTDKSFKLSDFSGKTVLLELITTQSPASLQQQKSIQAFLAGNTPDLVVVSLDIYANESADDLRSHAQMNHFQWSFGLALGQVLQEIGKQYGSQFTDPANTPLLVVDPQGTVHALPLYLTSQDQIKQAVAAYMPKM